MQVSFNPQKQYNPNFKRLTEDEVAYFTRHYSLTAKLKTQVLTGITVLDDADKSKLSAILAQLKEKGENAISVILDKILNPKN